MTDIMKYSAFIFDFDLTLADSSKPIIECFRHTLSVSGFEPPDDKSIFDTIGIPLKDALNLLSGNDSDTRTDEMRAVYVKKADEIMAKQTVFYPDTLDILEELRKKGKKTAIVSSKYRYRIKETFSANTDRFPIDLVIGFEDVNVPKPAPDGIIKAAEDLRLPLTDILYIGDSYIDAMTAQNAGTDFAAVTTGPTSAEKFGEYPNVTVASSLGELFNIRNL